MEGTIVMVRRKSKYIYIYIYILYNVIEENVNVIIVARIDYVYRPTLTALVWWRSGPAACGEVNGKLENGFE